MEQSPAGARIEGVVIELSFLADRRLTLATVQLHETVLSPQTETAGECTSGEGLSNGKTQTVQHCFSLQALQTPMFGKTMPHTTLSLETVALCLTLP